MSIFDMESNAFDSLFGGLSPTTTPPDEQTPGSDSYRQKYLAHLDASSQAILSAGYGGNSQQQWQNSPSISSRQFHAETGRIDAGIGTGDTPIRDSRGGITGYKSKPSTLTGGTSLTPQKDWDKLFPPNQPHSWDAGQPTAGLGTAKPSGFVGQDPALNTVTGSAGTLRSMSSPYGSGSSYTPNKKPLLQYGIPSWLQ